MSAPLTGEEKHCMAATKAFMEESRGWSYASESAVIANWWKVADWLAGERAHAAAAAQADVRRLKELIREYFRARDDYEVLGGDDRSDMLRLAEEQMEKAL